MHILIIKYLPWEEIVQCIIKCKWHPLEVSAPLLRCCTALESKAAQERGPEAAGRAGWQAAPLLGWAQPPSRVEEPLPLLFLGDPERHGPSFVSAL